MKLANSKALLLAGFVTIVAVALVQFLVASNWLPHVLGDELRYSVDARHTSSGDENFPNFFFYWVHNLLASTSTDFYLIQKGINSFFWALSGVLVLLAIWRKERLSWKTVVLTISLVLSPIALYVQAFLPEAFFTFLVTVSLFAVVEGERRLLSPSLVAAIAGALLGIAGLVKVHALFVLAGVVLYLLLPSFSKGAKQWVSVLLSAPAAFFAIKFSLGYLLAGPAGITILGKQYEAAIFRFLDTVLSSGVGDALVQRTTEPEVQLASAFGALAHPLVLIATAIVVFSIFGFSKHELIQARDPYVLLLLTVGVTALGTMLFTLLVSSLGDDHSTRVLFRYLEPLLPFSVFVLATREQKSASTTRILLPAGVLLSAWLLSNDFSLPDSATLFSLALLGPLGILLALGPGLVNKFRSASNTALVLTASAFLALPGVAGFWAQEFANQFGASYVSASQWAKENLSQAGLDSMAVIGAANTTNEATIFLIDAGSKPQLTYERGDIVDSSSIPESISVVILLDEIELNEGPFDQFQGTDFKIAIRAR